MIRIRSRVFAAMLLASTLAAPAWPGETIPPQIQVMPLIATSETVIGQPIAYPAGAAKVTAAIVMVPPGGETGWHTHAVPLFGYMLEGVLTVDYDSDGVRTYRTGDSLVEAMNWPHNGTNKGSTPVRILVVYIGADGIDNATPAPR